MISQEVRREINKISGINQALLHAKTITDVMDIINHYQGSIHSIYRIKNGSKCLVSGEIWFAQLSNYEEYMGSIIYRDKGSLFFTGNEKDIPSFKLSQDQIDLIKEIF